MNRRKVDVVVDVGLAVVLTSAIAVALWWVPWPLIVWGSQALGTYG